MVYWLAVRRENSEGRMSWSVSVPQQPYESFVTAVNEVQLAEDTYNPPELIEQWREQLEAARKGALVILAEAPFGREEAQWSASFSGHAKHAGADEGGSYTPSEFIHVTINRQPTS